MARRLSEAVRFKRVAFQRFEDAEILLANDRTTGAAYMVGYSVECAFKSLLLVGQRHFPCCNGGSPTLRTV